MQSLIGTFRVDTDSVAIGLSTLKTVAMGGLKEKPSARVAIPEDLKRLVHAAIEGSEEHKRFLIRVMNYYDRSTAAAGDAELISGIYKALKNLSNMDALIIITDDDVDREVAIALENSFPSSSNEISLSPKRNFLREYYTKIISWSKKTSGLIIEKSRRVFSQIGHHITTLQIPDKFDRLVSSKQRHIARVFSFRGGKGTKWFVSLASSAAGFLHPLLGAPGLIIAFMDP